MSVTKKSGICIILVVLSLLSLAYWGMNRSVTTAAHAYEAKPVTIVVDAGHGGEDGGAVSASGVPESRINLQISLRLEQLLALCGASPKLLRSQDVSLSTGGATVSERKTSDLKRRVFLVNAEEKALLVSIHQNHFSEPQYDGAQVFYAPTPGSRQLAEQMQTLLRRTLDPGNRRQCKPADSVYLMQKISCPGVLVECGFLSNPQEAAALQQPDYQIKLACAIGGAVVQYLEKGEWEVEVQDCFLLHSLRQ